MTLAAQARRRHTIPAHPAAMVGALLMMGGFAGPTAAHAAEPSDDKKKLGATWEVTRAGNVIGEEKLKLVVKKDGRRFLSVRYEPTKEERKRRKLFPLDAVLWRDGAGQLRKYERVQDKRLGEGIRVFRRGKEARMVGINARLDMKKVKLTDQVIIDPSVWGAVWDWLPRIRAAQPDQTVSFIDVSTRTAAQARVTRGEPIDVTNRKGEASRVTPWSIAGTSVKGLTLYLDGRHRLVGARSEHRAMLLKGWSWAAPPAEQPLPPDGATPPPEQPTTPDADKTPSADPTTPSEAAQP